MRNRTWTARTMLPVTVTAALTGALPTTGAWASEPGSRPLPPVTVLADKAGTSGGDIFVSPNSATSKYASGVEILSHDGRKVVWSHAVPSGQEAADFRKQTYHGRPVLTWWQGTNLGGLASGVDYVYNDH